MRASGYCLFFKKLFIVSTQKIEYRQCHSILYDLNNRKNTDGSSTIVLNGKKYRAKKIDNTQGYSVERTSHSLFDFINSWFGCSGKVTKFIAETINAPMKCQWHQKSQLDLEKSTANKPAIEGICFSGGGAKGIAYNGVIKQLGDSKLKQVTQVSGASAGALTAVLVAIGLSVSEIDAAFKKQSTELDQKVIGQNLKETIFFALNREPYLAHLKKMFKTDIVEQSHIENMTFSQLESLRIRIHDTDHDQQQTSLKQLFMSASLIDKVNEYSTEVKCSFDNTPNLSIVQAALASAALPFFFDPIEVEAKHIGRDFAENLGSLGQKVKLRDGGIHNNLPCAYLTTENNLLLAFEDNKGIHQRALNFSERLSQFLCGDPAYQYRQATHAIAERYGVHYISVDVSVIEVEKAKKHMDSITYQSAKDLDYFLKFERKPAVQRHDLEQKEKENRELNRLKYVGIKKLMNQRTEASISP